MLRYVFLTTILLGLVPSAGFGGETEVQYRVTGLFQPDRVEALGEEARGLDEFRLVSVDYDTAVATFAYDPDSPPFKNASEEQVRQRIDNQLRQHTRGVFSVRPLSTVPRNKLQEVRIGLEPLDCVACSFGAYLAVYNLNGVERATANLTDGEIVVWIDPSKTDREALKAALKKRGIKLSFE